MTDESRLTRVYLAGPEVFLPEARQIGAEKVALCAAVGLQGLFPLDQSLDVAGLEPDEQARQIALANETLMRSADALIANLTPFRGPSLDCGTAYEIGFMRALGRPVFGYTTTGADYHARVVTFRAHGGRWVDGDRPASLIEDFGLADNLMIDLALRESGFEPCRFGEGSSDMSDLAAFAACLKVVASRIAGRVEGAPG